MFQSLKWPDWARMGTLQTWHSLSRSYMETPSSCQPALSNSMEKTVEEKSHILPFSHSCNEVYDPLLSLANPLAMFLPLAISPFLTSTVYFCHQQLSQELTSALALCVFQQVRSGWPLSYTGTWALTYPQRTPALDWAVRLSTLIILLSSTPQSSQHPLTRRAIRFTCLSLWSSLSNTCRLVRCKRMTYILHIIKINT